jgi:hypothetical protein
MVGAVSCIGKARNSLLNHMSVLGVIGRNVHRSLFAHLEGAIEENGGGIELRFGSEQGRIQGKDKKVEKNSEGKEGSEVLQTRRTRNSHKQWHADLYLLWATSFFPW